MTNEQVKEVCDRYIAKIDSLDLDLINGSPTNVLHAKGMCSTIKTFIDEGRIEKAMRWLGFVQGVMFCEDIYSIDEMKEHNRSCEHEWKEIDDELGGNRTSVVCTKCKVSGERNDDTGEVFYPAT